ASTGAAAANGTVLGDLCLLCSSHGLQWRHRSLAVARVCLDWPASKLSHAGVGRRLCCDLPDASSSGGNSPTFAGDFSGRPRSLLSGLVVELMTAWSCVQSQLIYRERLWRFEMPVRNETSTRFMNEVRIISPWAFAIASLGYMAAGSAVVFAPLTNKTADPFYRLPVLVPLAILGGTLIACYILLIGYVNRDAGRRDMSRLAWTLLAIFIPHALGIVLYFVLRKPRILNCPQCSALIEPGFGFCPRCRCRLNAICPQCQRGVNAADKFCPYCGGDLGTSVNNVSVPLSSQS